MSTTDSKTNDLSVSKMDLTASKNETKETPAETNSSPSYSTGFCTTPECWKDYVYTSIISIGSVFLIIVIMVYHDKWKPFTMGILKLFKIFILYTIIISTIAVFVKAMSYLFWWFGTFYWYFERMLDPMKDQVVQSWYYYFTDYVNPLVLIWAFLWYMTVCFALTALLFLIILPAVSFIGFLIGYLFSLMGDDRCGKIKPPVPESPGTGNPILANRDMGNFAKGIMSGESSKLPDMGNLVNGAMSGPAGKLAADAMAGKMGSLAEMGKLAGAMSGPASKLVTDAMSGNPTDASKFIEKFAPIKGISLSGSASKPMTIEALEQKVTPKLTGKLAEWTVH